MTRERKLLSEALGQFEEVADYADRKFLVDNALEIADRIRALLSDPECPNDSASRTSEPEYVWRVTSRPETFGGAVAITTLSKDAMRATVNQIIATRPDDHTYVERAPIGPWEAVSDDH